MATIDMGRKDGGLLCPFRAEMGPRLKHCGLGRGLLPYQVASSSIQPFGHDRHGSKAGWWLVCPICSGGGTWVFIEHKVAWAEAYLHTKCYLSPYSCLVTTDIGQKLGNCASRGKKRFPAHLTISNLQTSATDVY